MDGRKLADVCGMSRSAFAVRFKDLGWRNTLGLFDWLENAEGNGNVAKT
jgi:hypothetical protein